MRFKVFMEKHNTMTLIQESQNPLFVGASKKRIRGFTQGWGDSKLELWGQLVQGKPVELARFPGIPGIANLNNFPNSRTIGLSLVAWFPALGC